MKKLSNRINLKVALLWSVGAFFASASWAASPVVDSLSASSTLVAPGGTISLIAQAYDPDCASTCTSGCGQYIRNTFTSWTGPGGAASAGTYSNINVGVDGSPYTTTADWTAPALEGTYTLQVSVGDSGTFMCGGRSYGTATIVISVSTAQPPAISSLTASPTTVDANGASLITCSATDPDDLVLTYSWSAGTGSVFGTAPGDPTATFTAPDFINGQSVITCTVTNSDGASDSAQVTVNGIYWESVRTLSGLGLSPARVAVNAAGEFIVSDTLARSVKWFTLDGSPRGEISNIAKPLGLEALPGGDWAIGDGGTGTVSVFNSWGVWQYDLGVGPGEFLSPAGIVLSSTNEIYVADSQRNRISVFDLNGQFLRAFGSGGSGDTELFEPVGVAVSPDGATVYVSDFGNQRIVLYQSDGQWIENWRSQDNGMGSVGGLWIGTDGTLFVTDPYQGRIQLFDPAGYTLSYLGEYGTGAGQLNLPMDCQGDFYNRLFVANTNSGSIEVYQFGGLDLAPQATANLSAQDVPGDNGGALRVQWTVSPDDGAGRNNVLGYTVLRKDPGETSFSERVQLGPGVTQYVDNTADTLVYIYRVRTSSMSRNTDSADASGMSLNDLPPGIPQNLIAASASPRGIVSVTWNNPPDPDIAGYTLAYGTVSGSLPPMLQLGPRTGCSLSSLPDRQNYYFSLQAVDTAGNVSGFSAEALLVYDNPATPEAPGWMSGLDTGMGGELFVWWLPSDPQDSLHTQVKYYSVNVRNVQTDESFTVSARDVKAWIPGLENDVPYEVSLRAVNRFREQSPASMAVILMPTLSSQNMPAAGEYGSLPQDSMPHIDSAGFYAESPDPAALNPDSKVWLAYEVTEVSEGEVEVIVNGDFLGAVPENPGTGWSATRYLPVPYESLMRWFEAPDGVFVQRVIFENTHNPPGAETWGVRNVRFVSIDGDDTIPEMIIDTARAGEPPQ